METPEGEPERVREGAEAIARLDEITRRLRRECPWDRVQDERSIVPHTVEESYELAEAAGSGDDAKLLDELGDVLFQVHFLSLLMEERGAGTLAEVAEGTRAKLIRRHPHVFGDAAAESAGEVLGNWDRIKREQEGKGGLFEDVPENLPALLHARKLQRRAVSRAPESADLGAVGEEGAAASLRRIEELTARLAELEEAGAQAGPEDETGRRAEVDEAIGELLFSAVDVARRLRSDPELSLRAAGERFRSDVGGPSSDQPA